MAADLPAFWAEFARLSPRLRAPDPAPDAIAAVGALVDRLGDLDWELGPDDDGDLYFAISPRGRRELAAAARAVIAAAPSLPGWRWRATLPVKAWDGTLDWDVGPGPTHLDTRRWTATLEPDTDGDLVIVTVAGAELAALTPPLAAAAARTAVLSWIGEETFLARVAHVRVAAGGARDDGVTLPDLRARLAAPADTGEDRFVACLLGLALGDALGARHEGGLVARGLWALLGIGRPGVLRWTDDTAMALGLARSLATRRGLDADHLAATWARDARWSRGYGPGALAVLRRVRRGEPWATASRAVFPDGSYGNGAAMRAAPLGLWFRDDAAALDAGAALAASITHAHPLGVEGGVLMARATAAALAGPLDLARLRDGCREPAFRDRLAVAADLTLDVAEVRRRLGSGIAATDSVPTALHLARRFDAFEPMLEFAVALRGDVDTIAAMAGALIGARHGTAVLPKAALRRLEARADLEAAARALFAARPTPTPAHPDPA